MATRIQVRRDTSSNWTSVNPVLAQGEIGLETDTNKFKFGDGLSNWNGLTYNSSGGGIFTGGTVNGETNFINGLTGNTIYSENFVGDGSNLGGTVGLTYSQMGFTITSPTPSTINQNVVLPYNSTVTYPTPLTVDVGYSVTIPNGTTLTII